MSHIAASPLVQRLSRSFWDLALRILLGSELAADKCWIASDSKDQFFASLASVDPRAAGAAR